MPKYSIIVPVYNCAAFLQECVCSILHQTYGDFELLLVDDGSTDGSAELCDQYANADSRVRVFHKPNGGAASARNFGLNHALGSYVLFIDGDDTISEDCLKNVDQALRKGTLVIFGLAFDNYRKNRLVCSEAMSCRHGGRHAIAEVSENFFAFYTDNQLSSACNKVFERSVIEKNGIRFREGMAIYEDFDFVLCVLQHTESVFCIDRCLYRYRILTDRPHDQKLQDIQMRQADLACLLRSFEELHDAVPAPAIVDVAAHLYMMVLQQHLMHTKHLSASVLADTLPAYCENPLFRRTLDAGARLDDNAERLLFQVDQRRFSIIASEFRRKRRKTLAKQAVKHILGK